MNYELKEDSSLLILNYSMKAMYKSELAELAGVSVSTFRRYLNQRRDVLAQMGVSPRAKMLPPKAVKFVVDDYSIDIPDEMQ